MNSSTTPRFSIAPATLPSLGSPHPANNAHSSKVNSSARVLANNNKKMQSSPFKKSLFGDVFGTRTMGDTRSMEYRVRVLDHMMIKKQAKTNDEILTEDASLIGSSMSSHDAADSGSESDEEVQESMNPKLQLAITLRNWSKSEDNNPYIVDESGVLALVAMAMDDNEDPAIKRCVVSAFFHLSSYEERREELINMGAPKAIIKIAKDVRSWHLAKLCALTLCNLSMQRNGEAVMAQEGAIFGLMTLLTIRGQRLLPVCVQALYNLTCVDNVFSDMWRIIKTLINIPQTIGFDHMIYLAKALYNCVRFKSMRSRVIEDGALGSLTSFIVNLPSRESKAESREAVYYVSTILKLLSDTTNCRAEMVTKGTIELMNMQPLLSNCDERSYVLLVTAVHNLLQGPVMPLPTFEKAVQVVAEIVANTANEEALLHASACIYVFTEDKQKICANPNSKTLITLIRTIPKLLDSTIKLTQFFTVTSCGRVFSISNNLTDVTDLEHLITRFVRSSPWIKDLMAIQALSISLCELSQEQFFMRFLVNLRLLEDLMELLLRLVESEMNDIVVQQTACIAISQIACYMDFLEDGLPTRIALALNKLLDVNEVHVLSNAICSIRSLGEAKLCHRELLSDEFLWRVANIVVKHKNNRILVKNCVAVLAVFSYDPRAHKGLGEATVMDVLFLTAKADDDLTRELVATTLCNISINTSVRRTMIIKGVAKVLANLSGTTSEIIQHLCATTICNVTCTTDLHSTLISNDILSTILMIAMVRAVAIHTKILCAKSLLNLISEDNAKALKQSGAIRIFSSLSTIDDEETQLMCAKGLLVYTGSTINREDIVQRRAVLLAIYAMVKSCKGKALEMVGLAICNLLSCPQCQHIAIQAGGLAVLKIFSSMNLPVLNDAAARLIINLSSEQSLKPALKKESLVPILVLYLQQSSTNTFRYALAALSSMCHTIDYHPQIIDRGGVSALVNAVISNRVSNTNYSREICRCIGLLSFHTRKVEDMVVHSNVVLALHILHRRALITPDAAVMIAVTFQNLSTDKKSAKYLMQQDGLKLFLNLLKTYPHESLIMYKAAVMFVFNLAQESSLHPDLLTQGIMNLLFQVILISPHFKPMKSTNESAASSRQSTSRGKKNRRSYLQSPDMSSTSLQAPNDSDDDSIVTKKSKNSKLSKLFGVSQNVVEKKLNADSEETTLPQKGKNNKLSKMFGVSETVVEKNKVDTSYDDPQDMAVTPKGKNSKLSKMLGVSETVVEKNVADVSYEDEDSSANTKKSKNSKLSKMLGVSETVVEKNVVDTSYDDDYSDDTTKKKTKNSKLSKMLGVSETVVEKNIVDHNYEDEGFEDDDSIHLPHLKDSRFPVMTGGDISIDNASDTNTFKTDDEDSSTITKKSKNSKLSKMLGVSETVVEKNVVDTSYDDDYSDDTTKKKTKNSKLSKMLGVSETVVEKNIVDHNYDDEGFEDEESSSSSKMKAKNSKLSKMFGVSETVVETSQTAPGYDEDNVSTQPKKSKNSKLSKMFGVSQSVVEKNSSRNSFSDDDQDDISLPSNRPSKAKNGLAIPIPHAPVVKLVFRFTKTDIYFISKTLSLMCHTPSCHEGVANGNVIHIFKTLLDDEDNVIAMAKHEMATTLCLLSSSKPCRPGLAKSGATEFAISLAQLSISSETQAKCAVAIGYLSDITALKPTVVTNLLWLQQRQIEQREENTEVTKIRLSDHRLSIGEMEKERISAQLKEYGKDALSVRELMWKAVDTIKKLDKAGTDMSNLNSARSPLRDSKVDFMKNIRDASPELNYIPKSDEYKLFEKAVNEYRNEGMTTIRSARVAVSSSETFYVQVQLKSELSEGGMAPLLRTDTFSLPEIHISDEAYVSSHQSRMKEFVINAPPPHPIEKDRRLLPEYFNVDDTTREAAEEVMAIGLSDYSTSDGGNDDSSRKRTSHSLGSSQPNSARLFAQLSARKFMKDHDDMTSKLHNLGLTANESEKTASDRRDIFDDFLNEVKETPKDKRRSSRRSDRIEKNRLSNSPVKHSFTSNKTHHVNRKKNPKNR